MGVRIFILFHIWTCSYVAVHHSQMLGISSNECRFRSTRSISRFCKWIASSRIFFTFDIFLPETGKHWVWLMIRELFFKRLRRQYNSYDDVRGKIVIKYMMWTLRAKWELVEFFFHLFHSTSRETNKYVGSTWGQLTYFELHRLASKKYPSMFRTFNNQLLILSS